MVALNVDLPREVPQSVLRSLARDAALSSPYSYLKKSVMVVTEARHDLDFLLRFVIKAYVVNVRLERRLVSDITERFFDVLREYDATSEARVH